MATANELLEDAKCYISEIDAGLIKYAVLAALLDVADGNPVPTSSDELMEEAKCLISEIPPGLVDYAILQAVSEITGGGGGGGGEVGVGSPEGVVTAPAGTTYLDTSTNSFWAKGSGAGDTGWILLIS